MHKLAEMNMAIRLVIINTQNMLAVQKLTLPALMRSLYFLDSHSFLAHVNHTNNGASLTKRKTKKAEKVSNLTLYGLRFSNL